MMSTPEPVAFGRMKRGHRARRKNVPFQVLWKVARSNRSLQFGFAVTDNFAVSGCRMIHEIERQAQSPIKRQAQHISVGNFLAEYDCQMPGSIGYRQPFFQVE